MSICNIRKKYAVISAGNDREHPVCNWSIPTSILYGGKDNMQSAEVVQKFAQEYSCNLMLSQESEHAFMQDGDRSIVEKWLEKNL